MKNFTPRPRAKLLVFLCLLFALPVFTLAQEGNFINVPASVTVEPGGTFSVRIDAQTGGFPVNGAEVHLNFDPTILQVANVNVLTTELPIPIGAGSDIIDNLQGQVDVIRGTFGAGISDDFDFFEIDFQVVGTGNTSISYNSVFPRETNMTSGGNSILGTPESIPITIAAQTEDPIASFTATPTSGTAALFVSVDASASSDPDGGSIVSYDWDFGDTNMATGVTADNNYTQPNTYTITLTVTDDEGETDTATQNITVDGVTITSYTVTASAGPNGAIDPTSALVEEGTDQTFTITPDTGYEIAGILAGGTSVGVSNPFVLTNVVANTSVEVSFSLINDDSVPVISLDATATVNEGGNISVPLSITDGDGDALTVTITSASNEPLELRSNNDPAGPQVEPYPFDASGFLTENINTDLDGLYSSDLVFAPTFGDGGSNGDGSGVYTVTVNVSDTDGNTVEKTLNLTVNDTPQLISDAFVATLQAESFDNQGPANTGSGDNGIGVEDNTPGGVINIGFTTNGDFAEYLIDVATAGTYSFDFFVAKASGPVGTMTVNGGPASISVNSTGDWQQYNPVSTNVVLPEGRQTLRFDWSGSTGFLFNMDYFVVTFVGGVNNPPVIETIADVDANEGTIVTVDVPVDDDGGSPLEVSLEIYDKSIGGGANTVPLTSGLTVPPTDYSFSDEGNGTYNLIWDTDTTDGRSYSATITANDGINPPVSETFTIDLAQNIADGPIKATTFNYPIPYYGSNPTLGYTVAVESSNNNIGYIDSGEAVEYLINVPSAGTYELRVNASKGSNGGGNPTTLTISEDIDGFSPIGTLSIPNTGWTPYVNYTVPVIFTNAGVQKLRFDFGGTMNIQEFELTPSTSNTPPIVEILTPNDGLNVEQGVAINFTATADDTQDGDVAASLVWNSDIDGDFGTGSNVNTSALSIGTHTITATVTDSDTTPLTGSASITVSIIQTAPACDVRFRVNAGGSLLANSTGNFEEDQTVAGTNGTSQTGTPSPYIDLSGTAFDKTFGSVAPLVSNTTGYPDVLFQTERYSDAANPNNMNWTFPTENGIYDVKILFNENYTGEIGDPRVFDVEIEGDIALDDYRPSGPTGADVNVAKVEIYQATVTDGELNINFIKGTQNPSVKGFDICFIAPVSDTAPVVAINAPLDGANLGRNVDVSFSGVATDVEDDDTTLTAALSWNSPTEPSLAGTGGSFTDRLFVPGPHTIQASVTDSDDNTVVETITVNVAVPGVAITFPEEDAVLANTDIRFTWSTENMLLFSPYDEHVHFYVNPVDPNNPDYDDRISTVSDIGQLFWDLNADDGIVEGENTVVIIAADGSHTEFTNPEARDIVNFTVCSTSISNIVASDPTECGLNNGEIVIEATGTNLEYSIDNGANFQAANSFNGISAGTYDIVVRQIGSNSCSATDTVILESPAAATPIVSGPTTYLEGSGGVTLDAGAGYASYLWSPNGETTQTITVLEGTYSVTVTEANGCEGTSIGIIVTEEDDITPPEAICQSITVQLDETGNASITAADIDNGSNDTSGIADLSIDTSSFDCSNIGANTVTLTVMDNNNNISSCTATVTVEDTIAPVITCPGNIEMLSSSSQVLNIIPATATDNCGNAAEITFERSDNPNLTLNDPFPQGITTIQWTAMDASGNTDNCEQTITITLPQSTANEIVAFSVSGQVGAETIDSNAGSINLTVAIGTDVTSLSPSIDISQLATISPDSGLAQNFSAPVDYVVSAEDGSTKQWTVSVTVQDDTTDPEIACLSNIQVNNDIGECGAVVTYEEPVGTDNLPGATTEQTSGLPNGGIFPIGITTQTYRVTDAEGNIASCSFTITVIDAENPVITCPTNVSVTIASGLTSSVVTFENPSISDNCVGSVLAQTAGLPSGSEFPIGTTVNTFQVTDAVGNTATCSFEVRVEEEVANSVLSVTSFTLINADTDNDLFTLTNGMAIDVNSLPTLHLDVRANTTDDVESVRFVLGGNKGRTSTESVPPYALFQDFPTGNYRGSDLTTGNYTLTGTPYSGNSAGGNQGTSLTIGFELIDGDPVCANVKVTVQTATNPTGCGLADGSIVLNVVGTTGNLDYDWGHDADLESATATGLSAGSYSVTVTDANGCTNTVSAVLEGPTSPTVSLSPFADISETASPISLSGGSPSGGTYSGIGVDTNGVFSPSIGVGTYVVTYSYTDPTTGCDGSATRTIRVISSITDSDLTVVNANTDTPLYALVDGLKIQKSDIGNTPIGIVFEPGNNPSRVKFTLTGPISRKTTEGKTPYSLYGDIGVDIQGRVFPIGAYTLVVEPSNAPTIRVNFEVTDIDPICAGFNVAVQSVNNPTVCNGTDGSLGLSVTGGAAPFDFNWSHDSSLESGNAMGLSAGRYTVTVTDTNGCMETLTATLQAPQSPRVTLSALANVSDDAPAFALSGGSPAGGTYSGTGVNANGVFNPSIGAGIYTVTYSYTDPTTGCDGSATRTIRVTSPITDSDLTVVNANTDTPLYALVDGLIIQKEDIGNTPLGIIYEPGNSPSNVRFTLTGPISRSYSEGKAPYSLYGDIGVDIQGRVFPVGSYTLVVNPSNAPAITVNFSVVQGISNTAKSAPQMMIFPNPAIDITTVSFPEPVQLTQFYVYDVTGRLVKTIASETAEDIDSIELSVYDLPIGTYFVRTTDTSGKGFQQRLIIEK
ncbi:Por secretion system C-terminal sorting domain-containing protein [Pricia antarctica]|uniref:Por secretion system C-terminal sorting domain-containing protein n=1 Tax=Pricia antarctica TaxID=641691 RepID=A0A1G7FVJ0_9FLAO|nr:HYR domain-containing protein [Pricia antarctica]SDE79765.1 Por secretion system C-terminal sorting domain-containing protein [Pricia antarctica]